MRTVAKQLSAWFVTAFAVVALMASVKELSASANPCEPDVPNGIMGYCAGVGHCEDLCEFYHPTSTSVCGECCWCIL
jgi:hypothetical protein